MVVYQAQIFSLDKLARVERREARREGRPTSESQEPVHKLMPSLLTPRQLTRFSWPLNEPTFSPLNTSHTCKRRVSGYVLGYRRKTTYLALVVVITSEEQSSGD